MANILIAISSDIYVRNYLRTDALTVLRKHHSCTVIADETLALAEEVSREPDFGGFYEIDAKTTSQHNFSFQLSMWRHRKKSRTFLYRWMRNSGWANIDTHHGTPRKVLSFLGWIIRSLRSPRWILLPILGSRMLFPLVFFFSRMGAGRNASLEKLVKGKTYDLLLFPSSAFDSAGVLLSEIGERESIPTLCLIDNWDNLTSKTVFWQKPTHLGVWGEQAKEQAITIHGFTENHVHLVGTPRFDHYFQQRTRPIVNPIYSFPYVLFVGSAMPFDEIGALHKIEESLRTLAIGPDDLRVVYRPHPWQQRRKSSASFNEEEFERTSLDLQIATAYAQGTQPESTDPAFQPDLDYYPALLLGARLVVGPLTTMLLEASLCLRPVVALSYDDNFHFTASRRYFTHFDGFERVPGFSFCDSVETLSEELDAALQSGELDALENATATSYFISQSDNSYGERLTDLASRVAAQRSETHR
jgi:hypothetical protein